MSLISSLLIVIEQIVNLASLLSVMWEIIKQVSGAFAGAFFAFIFLKFAEYLSDITKRKNKHHDSLVGIEHQLIESLNVISDNLFVMKKFRSTVEGGDIHWNILEPIPFDNSNFRGLVDIECVNRAFSLYTKVTKANCDMKTVSTAYSEIKDAYISKNIEIEQYKTNAKLAADTLDIIKEYLENKILKEMIEVLAYIKIMMRHSKPKRSKLILSRIKMPNVTDEEIEKEVEKINKTRPSS